MGLVEFCSFHDDPDSTNSFSYHILISFVLFESVDIVADDGSEIWDGDGDLVIVEGLDGGGEVKEEGDEDILGDSDEGGIGLGFNCVLVVHWHFLNRVEFKEIGSSCFDQTLQRCVLAFIALPVE